MTFQSEVGADELLGESVDELRVVEDVQISGLRRRDRAQLISVHLRLMTSANAANTQGEVTSQSLWSRYDRHFVGITRYNALS